MLSQEKRMTGASLFRIFCTGLHVLGVKMTMSQPPKLTEQDHGFFKDLFQHFQ